jgi:ABC-type glycerol-3-phosphate transport system substrate-binding protein
MFNKNKTLIIIVSLSIISLIFFSTQVFGGGTKEKVGKKVQITIAALNDISTQTALNILRESDFEETTGITVEANLLEFAPMVEAHKMDFMSHAGRYDLVAIDQPSLGLYVTSGWVMPLDNFINDTSLPSIDKDDLIPALLGPCGIWEGKLYAIPMGSYGNLFAFRKDLLKKAGLVDTQGNPKPPATFEEFYAYAKKLNNPPDVYGTVLYAHKGEYLSYDLGSYLWSWGAGFINGSDVNIEGWPKFHVAWDTPEGLEALKFYVKLYQEGLVPEDSLNYDHTRFTEAFQVGKVAMGLMIGEAVGEPMENPDKSKVIGKIGYAPMPGKLRADGTISPPIPHIGAHSLAINKDSKNPKEAYLVLQFLTGKAIGKEYILRGGKPFRFSHFFDEAFVKYPHMTATRNNMPTGKCRPNIPEYPAVSEIFSTALHRVLSGEGDVVEVMKAAAQKANNEVLKPSYPKYY